MLIYGVLYFVVIASFYFFSIRLSRAKKIQKYALAGIHAFLFAILFSFFYCFLHQYDKKEIFTVTMTDVNICQRNQDTGICDNTIQVAQPQLDVDTSYINSPKVFYAPYTTTSYTINESGQLTNGSNILPPPQPKETVSPATATATATATSVDQTLYITQDVKVPFSNTTYYLYTAKSFTDAKIIPTLLKSNVKSIQDILNDNKIISQLLCIFGDDNKNANRIGIMTLLNSNASTDMYGFLLNDNNFESTLKATTPDKANIVFFDYAGPTVYSICHQKENWKSVKYIFSQIPNNLQPVQPSQIQSPPSSCPSCPPSSAPAPIKNKKQQQWCNGGPYSECLQYNSEQWCSENCKDTPYVAPPPPPPPPPITQLPWWEKQLSYFNNIF